MKRSEIICLSIVGVILLSLAGIYIFFGTCSPVCTVRDPEIQAFNRELKEEFEEIRSVKTYIQRPTMYWEIKAQDGAEKEKIFQYIVSFLKTSNIYEEKLKEEYTNRRHFSDIAIEIYDGVSRERYDGYYMSRYDYLTEDNFVTWYRYTINDGAASAAGTYEYQE